ncbi:hypothetical protein [Deinococcus hopiensis]|uniref:Uncharacterized protein n=1 Tax=Deinococcus hopiensis KR-140 TaxID=695939 RepID=A0A1W1VJ24_9DEIO|nr:hypothetical protein [Deinococcus hopiensis]SMB93230.1 hypothetical protein SAMN00790413_01899 [Deinococcus hopiensis KR-140]
MSWIVMQDNREAQFMGKTLGSGMVLAEPLREAEGVEQRRIAWESDWTAAEVDELVNLNPQVQVLDALPADWRPYVDPWSIMAAPESTKGQGKKK